MFERVGFIGTGNMGSAVAKVVCASRLAKEIYLSNRTPAKAEALAKELGTGIVTTNEDIAARCDLIFLGVKPQVMPQMLAGIADTLARRDTQVVLATMAAGLTCQRIGEMARTGCPIIRFMPNIPVALGAGVVQYCGKYVTQEQMDDFAALLMPAGLVDPLDESLIDAATCVSGCGPAFADLFLEALADGGVACGLPRDKAMKYAAQMLEGAARMALESGQHPGALKDAVCSPGGTTIQGVRKLEEGGFRAAAMNAVIAAYEKTLGL